MVSEGISKEGYSENAYVRIALLELGCTPLQSHF